MLAAIPRRTRSRASNSPDWLPTVLTGRSSVERRRIASSGRPASGRDARRELRHQRRERREGAGAEAGEHLVVVVVDAVAERRRDRGVGQPDSADRHAAAAEDPEAALGREPGELPGEARLADPRLARDQEVRRIVGDPVEDALGQTHLVGPADEDGTDASPRHPPIIEGVGEAREWTDVSPSRVRAGDGGAGRARRDGPAGSGGPALGSGRSRRAAARRCRAASRCRSSIDLPDEQWWSGTGCMSSRLSSHRPFAGDVTRLRPEPSAHIERCR